MRWQYSAVKAWPTAGRERRGCVRVASKGGGARYDFGLGVCTARTPEKVAPVVICPPSGREARHLSGDEFVSVKGPQ